MGTDQYYIAFSNEDPTDWLYANWFDGECDNLYNMFGYKWEDQYDEEYEEVKDDYENYEAFTDAKYEEWCQDCTMSVEPVSPGESDEYVPGGEGHLEIVYDERRLEDKFILDREYLVVYDGNYADEFDVYFHDVMTGKQLIDTINEITFRDFYEEEFYFGTNECIDVTSEELVSKLMNARLLTEEQVRVLRELEMTHISFGDGLNWESFTDRW